MTVLYTGALLPYPGIPDHWDAAKQARAQAILDQLPEGPLAITPGADAEDFWDDACRRAAAIRCTHGDILFSAHAFGMEGFDRLGPILLEEEDWDARDPFIAHPLVLKYGGRPMLLGSWGGANDVCNWLADLSVTRQYPACTPPTSRQSPKHS